MNSASSRLRSTATTSSDIDAIWPGALLAVYLAATQVLLLLGRGDVRAGSVALHAVLLAAVAACTWLRGVPRWLQAFAPLLALLFLYSELPALIRAAGHVGTYDAAVHGWELTLWGTQPATAWAAALPSRAVSEVLHGAYLSYYAIIFSVPVALFLAGRQREFAAAVFVLLLTFVGCFVCYIAFPVAGPRYLQPTSIEGGTMRSLVLWVLEARSSRGTAFPSSHVAVAATQSVLAVRYLGRKGWVIAALTLLLALGAVYGGFHYAVDVVAGAVFGLAVPALAAAARLPRPIVAQTSASAPT